MTATGKLAKAIHDNPAVSDSAKGLLQFEAQYYLLHCIGVMIRNTLKGDKQKDIGSGFVSMVVAFWGTREDGSFDEALGNKYWQSFLIADKYFDKAKKPVKDANGGMSNLEETSIGLFIYMALQILDHVPPELKNDVTNTMLARNAVRKFAFEDSIEWFKKVDSILGCYAIKL